MKVVYVAGPYSAPEPWGIAQNIKHALDAAQRLWSPDTAVICPHGSSAWMEGERQMFLNGDLEILSRCDGIFMLSGWRNSEGAKGELGLAKRLGLEIMYEVNE